MIIINNAEIRVTLSY